MVYISYRYSTIATLFIYHPFHVQAFVAVKVATSYVSSGTFMGYVSSPTVAITLPLSAALNAPLAMSFYSGTPNPTSSGPNGVLLGGSISWNATTRIWTENDSSFALSRNGGPLTCGALLPYAPSFPGSPPFNPSFETVSFTLMRPINNCTTALAPLPTLMRWSVDGTRLLVVGGVRRLINTSSGLIAAPHYTPFANTGGPHVQISSSDRLYALEFPNRYVASDLIKDMASARSRAWIVAGMLRDGF